MKIEDIQYGTGRHYLMVWIAAFRVLLGWSEKKTLAWASKWKKDLNLEEGASSLFYHESHMYYVAWALMDVLFPNLTGMDRYFLRQRLHSALTNFESSEGKANWDLFAARYRLGACLAEYRTRLPSPLISANGKNTRKAKRTKSAWPDDQFFLLATTGDGAIRQMEKLLKKGVDLNSHGETNWTPIMEACRSNRLDALKWLIDKGADVNACTQDGRGITALMIAAENGNEESLRVLIKAGAELNRKDHEGQTALHFAARSGREGSVRILIKAGATISKKKAELCSLLWMPSFEGRLDILKQFKKAGARINDCSELLVVAVETNDIEMVEFYLQAGADVNAVYDESWPRTPLMAAAFAGYEDIARLLLKFGADVKASTGEGRNATLWAKEKGHAKIIKLLESAVGS